jgi:hypothetical protein
MAKRLFDRLAFFGRAWFDLPTATSPVRPPQRRYAVNLLDMGDPTLLRDEAMATLYEPLDLAVRGHLCPPRLKTIGLLRKTQHRGRARVRWMFLFGLAAYNLVRIRNLAVATE